MHEHYLSNIANRNSAPKNAREMRGDGRHIAQPAA
jgi:hypothetical protein